jgi:hypothetical protein
MQCLVNNLKLEEPRPLITMLKTTYTLMGVGAKSLVNSMNVLKEDFNSHGGIDYLEKLQTHKLD